MLGRHYSYLEGGYRTPFEDGPPFPDNETLCTTYIPSNEEYHTALGGWWLFFILFGIGTCLLLYGLFIEQLVNAVQYSHAVFRNSLIWTASLYPFMTLMTIIGFTIPRAQSVCYTVKVLYMLIAISKFTDLTLLMYGSEEVMLWKLKEENIKMNKGPLCCFFFCIPHMRITKKKLRYIIAGVQQLPYTQSFYLVMLLILNAANEIIIGSLDPKGSYLWLNLFSFFTSMLGVYCLNLMSEASYDFLQQYNYSKMSFVMKALILVTKLQSFAFNIMAYYEVFPCHPPISHYVYKDTVENYLYIFEMLLFGLLSYKIYRKIPFETMNPTVIRTDDRGNTLPHHEATIPSFTHGFEARGYVFPSDDFISDANIPGNGNDEIFVTGHDNYDFSGTSLVLNDDSPNLNQRGNQSFI